MNFLAHLFLSEDSSEGRLGNLLGDFVRSPLPDSYSAAIKRGIVLHRKIDAYTDAHPLFQTSQRRISQERRRFSGILIDIFYDHFLATHWSTYSAVPLESFTRQVYISLQTNAAILPGSLIHMAPYMIRDNWLMSYLEFDGIDKAIKRIARRFRRVTHLASAVEELEQQYVGLQADFLMVKPDKGHA